MLSELIVGWDLEVVPVLTGLPALDRVVEMEGGGETGGELRVVFAWTVSSWDLLDGLVPKKKFGELVFRPPKTLGMDEFSSATIVVLDPDTFTP